MLLTLCAFCHKTFSKCCLAYFHIYSGSSYIFKRIFLLSLRRVNLKWDLIFSPENFVWRSKALVTETEGLKKEVGWKLDYIGRESYEIQKKNKSDETHLKYSVHSLIINFYGIYSTYEHLLCVVHMCAYLYINSLPGNFLIPRFVFSPLTLLPRPRSWAELGWKWKLIIFTTVELRLHLPRLLLLLRTAVTAKAAWADFKAFRMQNQFHLLLPAPTPIAIAGNKSRED